MKEQMKQTPTEHLLPKLIHDEKGNPTQRFDSDKEKENFDILSEYRRQLQFCNCHLIREVFFEAIRKNKLNCRVLMQFITEHCWYGKELSIQLPNNQTGQFNWIALIAPSLNEYFRQIDYFFADPTTNAPNFVLSLDSLTLKIEGLFRELCFLAGVGTSQQKQDWFNRNIVREKAITVLLRDDAIKKIIDRDDLLFFKFLLIEQLGFNLRNNIAHSLMPYQEYRLDYMHLVILALLRLGKYDFTQDTDTALDVDEDSDLSHDDEIVESINQARDQMKQGKFISKENVLEDV